jgi:acetyl-CoA C-acetyltransferase
MQPTSSSTPRPHCSGKFGGSLAKIPAPELGAAVIADVLKRARLSGDQVGEVIMGQVLTGGSGQNPARQAVLKAGLPEGVPASRSTPSAAPASRR